MFYVSSAIWADNIALSSSCNKPSDLSHQVASAIWADDIGLSSSCNKPYDLSHQDQIVYEL